MQSSSKGVFFFSGKKRKEAGENASPLVLVLSSLFYFYFAYYAEPLIFFNNARGLLGIKKMENGKEEKPVRRGEFIEQRWKQKET